MILFFFNSPFFKKNSILQLFQLNLGAQVPIVLVLLPRHSRLAPPRRLVGQHVLWDGLDRGRPRALHRPGRFRRRHARAPCGALGARQEQEQAAAAAARQGSEWE